MSTDNGIPTLDVADVKIKVEALPAANLDGEQTTRVWSGTTLQWEKAGGASKELQDRISLVYHGGYSGADLSHSGEYSGVPFQSEPYGNITTLVCQEPADGGADTGGYLPWTAMATIAVGSYTAFYPYIANVNPVAAGVNNLPVKFDISEQSINTNEIAAYMYTGKSVYLNDGLLGVEKQEANPDDTQLSIKLNPVSSLLHLVLSGCPDVTFTRITIENVGTGFEYYPQEGAAFGFSTENYTNQRTAADLVAEGWAQNYQEGTITLTGEVQPNGGVLEVWGWYLPVQEITANAVITLYTADGAAYTINDMPDMTTIHEGAHLARFNSGVTIRRALAGANGGDISGEEDDPRMDDVVPDDIRTKMRDHMPIYSGTTPPNVEDAYFCDLMETVYCEDYATGGGFAPGDIVNSMYLRFYNQDAKNNTLDYEGKSTGSQTESATNACISGNGNNFTIFFNTVGQNQGISTKTALVISGTKTASGIKDLYYAFVMVEKGSDPSGKLMAEGVFRVFKDKDGLSVPVTWPGSLKNQGKEKPYSSGASVFSNAKAVQ